MQHWRTIDGGSDWEDNEAAYKKTKSFRDFKILPSPTFIFKK
jgi:hypothetical protein